MRFNLFFALGFVFCLAACSSSSSGRGIASETVTGATEEAPFTNPPCQGEKLDLCITIDRNPAVQKMVVYKDGKVAYSFPVSTGRETFDIPTNFNYSPSCSTTPTGIFKPGILRERHYSNTWLVKNEATGKYEDGAPMDHSIFFNDTGVAIHAAGTREAAAALGPKNDPGGTGSGGCVRTYPYDAKTIFDEIAGCSQTEKRDVCVERETVPPTGRTNADGTTKMPKCLRFEKLDSCVAYNKNIPSCAAEAKVIRPGHCEDPKQFIVNKQPAKSYAIEVTDSRSKEQIAAVKAKCEADKEVFNQRKAECLAQRMEGVLPADKAGQYASIKPLQSSTNPTQQAQFSKGFEGIFKSLDSSTRNRLSFQCNEQLYAEAQKLRSQMVATGQTAPLPTNINTAETAPLPPPKPERPKRKGLFGWLKNLFT